MPLILPLQNVRGQARLFVIRYGDAPQPRLGGPLVRASSRTVTEEPAVPEISQVHVVALIALFAIVVVILGRDDKDGPPDED